MTTSGTAHTSTDLDSDRLLGLLEMMERIRTFEEVMERRALDGDIPGVLHLSVGQEAVAAGVCAALRPDDYLTSTHRCHGHAIAKGLSLDGIAAELFGKATGVNRGKGGSMHLADVSRGMLGGNGIIGGGFGIATGAALSARLRGTEQIAVCMFGDGGANKGTFHEALNLAAIRKLGVVFVCENNQYAQFTSVSTAFPIADIADRAASYGIPGVVVDGNDAIAVYEATREAVRRARAGLGPTLLEMKTYRYKGHYLGDPERYRTREEIQSWRARDPIVHLRNSLRETGLVPLERLDEIHQQAEAEVAHAVDFALASPFPDPSEAFEDLFAPPSDWAPTPSEAELSDVREMTSVEAEREALALAMRRDPTVFVMGLDIQFGGSFGQFLGLTEEFGAKRVMAMPISESAMIATALGAAATGCRPIISMNYIDFAPGAMDELLNQTAKLRYRLGGQVKVPLVLRSSDGAVRAEGAHQSQCLEAIFTHVPGFRVVTPSTPADVKGLLLSSIAEDNPVIFLQSKLVHRLRGPVANGWAATPFGQATIAREGNQVTLVTYAFMVRRALEAAELLAAEGISVEVIDLRSLAPLDFETIARSVRKTHRAVIAHEACRTGGFGAEIAARIQEEVFDYLEAPVRRVGARDMPIPSSPVLEKAVLPQVDDLLAAVRMTVS